jgi:hypothetical protein
MDTQAEIDAFPSDCINMNITMYIGTTTAATTDINNLDALSNLETTSKSIFIRNNPELTSLGGLSNLSSIDIELTIENNDALTDLSGLGNLSNIGGWFSVFNNQNLTSFDGLGPVPTLGSYLFITFNPSLTNISELSDLTDINGFVQINNNNSLTSLDGLQNVTAIGPVGNGYVYIASNNSLASIDAFNSTTSVTGNFEIEDNPSLVELNGFGSLSTVGGVFIIEDNPLLTDIDDFSSLTSIGSLMTISGNSALTSLLGLTSDFSIGSTLSITSNPSLSTCDAQSICDHLGDNLPATITGNATNCQNITAVLVACGLLPVEMTYFKGQSEQGSVLLSWQTATEKNNAWFEIEHKAEGSEAFSQVGKVAGKGDATTLNDYSFRHTQPAPGTNYYRLKQVDFDGQFEYSDIVGVAGPRQAELSVFPNPTVGLVTVRGLKEEESRSAVVRDFAGREVLREDLTERNFIDLSSQPNGVYFIEIQTQNQKVIQRVIKE